jgi:hypothetical protein
MSIKVLYLPGLLGSDLAWEGSAAGTLQPVWADPATILAGGLAYLDLADDGSSPGPLAEGKSIVPVSILPSVYAPLAVYMLSLGWDVLPLGYDFRLSHLANAKVLWPFVQEWAAGQPIYIVAHSAGGILARCLYGQMAAHGADAQLARIVTIGTPHFGSFEVVRLWSRLPLLYRALLFLTAGALTWPEGAGPAYLDQVIASWPSFYELQSFAASGPLFTQYPDQAAAIYRVGNYQGGNGFLSASAFLSGQLVQGELAAWYPPGRLVCIAGMGTETVFALAPGQLPGPDAEYQSTQDGDGLVTLAQTSPPGVPVFPVSVAHGLQPLSPLVWSMLDSLVLSGSA